MRDNTRALKDILWVLALLGLLAGVFRLWFGLGATTNLSDAMPWGLWKILNMVAGVALSTSGFTVGLLVYVLGMKQLQPLMKPAILVAFLGYGCSMLALLFDIGLPQRFWHPILMWNEHSFLFEVFWCVLLYFTVTFVEMLPVVCDRVGGRRLARVLHTMAFGVVIVGISLSSLHHSSLGSLFLVTPFRLHALWYSAWLPLFFILSAMGGGIMLLVLLRILYAKWYDPEPIFGPGATETACAIDAEAGAGNRQERQYGTALPPLATLASVGVGILGLYLAVKLVDLFRGDGWHYLLAGTWESWLYVLELALAVLVPALLIAFRRTRHSPLGLGMAGLAASMGLVLNRLNVGIFGYFRDAGSVYFPSMAEWALGVGVIAAAGLVFFFVVENFAVFDEQWRQRRRAKPLFNATFDRWTQVWYAALMNRMQRVTLMAVFVVPLGWVLLYPPYHDGDASDVTVRAATGIDVAREVLCIDGNRGGVVTDFPHVEHRTRLGGDSSCTTCHHMSLPGDRSTPCSRCHRNLVRPTKIFDHPFHLTAVAEQEAIGGLHPTNYSCALCHAEGEPETAANTKPCYDCHEDDMWLEQQSDPVNDYIWAVSFQAAMHGTCVECHRREQVTHENRYLGECSTCHSSLEFRRVAQINVARARRR